MKILVILPPFCRKGGRCPSSKAYLYFELRHVSLFFFLQNLSLMAFEPMVPSKKKSLFSLVYFFSLLDGSQYISMYVYSKEEVAKKFLLTLHAHTKNRACHLCFLLYCYILLSRARFYKIDRHNPIRWWLWCGVGICVCLCVVVGLPFGGIRSLVR